MTKLKLGPIADDKPVKLGRENNHPPTDPIRLIVPMLERFIATDRAFAKARRTMPGSGGGPS